MHTLKIDRSFIEGLGRDPEGGAIVAAVVQLGHALGLSVTAEGIETPDQLAELRALGCDLGQGYYFAHPQPGAIVRATVDASAARDHHYKRTGKYVPIITDGGMNRGGDICRCAEPAQQNAIENLVDQPVLDSRGAPLIVSEPS